MTSNEIVYLFIIICIIILFIITVRYLCIRRLESSEDSDYDEISSEDSLVLEVYDKCSICMSSLVVENQNCVVLNCNHVLHKKCLERFKKSNLEFNCPICREKIINYTKIDR
jgi:hypothetical protein